MSRASWARGTTRRIALTTALISILIMTPITYGLDAAGGHPARSAPLVLWIVWFAVLFPIRLLIRNGRRRRAKHAAGVASDLPAVANDIPLMAADVPLVMSDLPEDVRRPSSSSERIAQLRELAELRNSGMLTEEEFASEKTRLLDS